ncbi:hypothetical protein BH23VER1_BH23VER1_25890 [soil metagenome]
MMDDDQLPLDFSRPSVRPVVRPRPPAEAGAGPVQPGLDLAGTEGPARRRSGAPDGVDRWRAERRAQQEALAYDLGLPLGREVECELREGSLLRGTLRLDEASWLKRASAKKLSAVVLRIGRATFEASDVARCVAV